MKLNKNDIVRDNDRLFEVIAVVWSTIYLRPLLDGDVKDACCTLEDVHRAYRSVEFLKT